MSGKTLSAFRRLASLHMRDRRIGGTEDAPAKLASRIRLQSQTGMRDATCAMMRHRDRAQIYPHRAIAEIEAWEVVREAYRKIFREKACRREPLSHEDVMGAREAMHNHTARHQETLLHWAAAEATAFRLGKMILATERDVRGQDERVRAIVRERGTPVDAEFAAHRAGARDAFYGAIRDWTREHRNNFAVVVRSFREQQRNLDIVRRRGRRVWDQLDDPPGN